MIRISLVLLAISIQASDIRISEVMSNPQGSEYENEFIEIYNSSDHVMQINGWILSDGKGVDTITHLSGPGEIQAAGYAVILDPSYPLISGPYLIPDSIPLFTISTDATFGSAGLSNTGESVIIRSPDSASFSQMFWTSATENGFSWERVALDVPDFLAVWQQSLVEDGTPGYSNSVTLPQYNLSLDTIQVVAPAPDEALELKVTIINHGSASVSSANLKIQISQQDQRLVLRENPLPEVLAGDTLVWLIEVLLDRCGWIAIDTEISLLEDASPEDNNFNLETYLSCLESPLIINEIMPIPRTDQAEWIEIYNRSDRLVNLMNWEFSDDKSTGKVVTDSSLNLAANDYLLLSNQDYIVGRPWSVTMLNISGFPTLNNTADAVKLFDPRGKLMDQMAYDDFSALVEGRSWERIRSGKAGIDSENWGVCIYESASSPGYKNSLDLLELVPDLLINLAPNPFTPNGDGQQDELIIHYELPFEQALMSITIFDMAGRKIAEPVLIKAVAHRGNLTWNGAASYGGIAVTGLYICKLQIDNMQGQVTEILKKVYLVR